MSARIEKLKPSPLLEHVPVVVSCWGVDVVEEIDQQSVRVPSLSKSA